MEVTSILNTTVASLLNLLNMAAIAMPKAQGLKQIKALVSALLTMHAAHRESQQENNSDKAISVPSHSRHPLHFQSELSMPHSLQPVLLLDALLLYDLLERQRHGPLHIAALIGREHDVSCMT